MNSIFRQLIIFLRFFYDEFFDEFCFSSINYFFAIFYMKFWIQTRCKYMSTVKKKPREVNSHGL